jgi:hypothetical protein
MLKRELTEAAVKPQEIESAEAYERRIVEENNTSFKSCASKRRPPSQQ